MSSSDPKVDQLEELSDESWERLWDVFKSRYSNNESAKIWFSLLGDDKDISTKKKLIRYLLLDLEVMLGEHPELVAEYQAKINEKLVKLMQEVRTKDAPLILDTRSQESVTVKDDMNKEIKPNIDEKIDNEERIMRSMSVTELRDKLRDIITSVEDGSLRILIEKHNRPRAVMLSYEDYKHLEMQVFSAGGTTVHSDDKQKQRRLLSQVQQSLKEAQNSIKKALSNLDKDTTES